MSSASGENWLEQPCSDRQSNAFHHLFSAFSLPIKAALPECAGKPHDTDALAA